MCVRVGGWVGGWMIIDLTKCFPNILQILPIQPNILLTLSYYSPVILETTTVGFLCSR